MGALWRARRFAQGTDEQMNEDERPAQRLFS